MRKHSRSGSTKSTDSMFPPAHACIGADLCYVKRPCRARIGTCRKCGDNWEQHWVELSFGYLEWFPSAADAKDGAAPTDIIDLAGSLPPSSPNLSRYSTINTPRGSFG